MPKDRLVRRGGDEVREAGGDVGGDGWGEVWHGSAEDVAGPLELGLAGVNEHYVELGLALAVYARETKFDGEEDVAGVAQGDEGTEL